MTTFEKRTTKLCARHACTLPLTLSMRCKSERARNFCVRHACNAGCKKSEFQVSAAKMITIESQPFDYQVDAPTAPTLSLPMPAGTPCAKRWQESDAQRSLLDGAHLAPPIIQRYASRHVIDVPDKVDLHCAPGQSSHAQQSVMQDQTQQVDLDQ